MAGGADVHVTVSGGPERVREGPARRPGAGARVPHHGALDRGRRLADDRGWFVIPPSLETAMKRTLFAILASTLLLGAAHGADDNALRAAVAAPSRTPANVARDVYRHPYETLNFFGIAPG